MDIATLQAWLPTAVAGGALALVWNDVRKSKAELRRSLYHEDGTTNYMPRLSCEREQARCQILTCGKIEALSAKMDLMDSRRENAKEQQQAQMGDVKQAIAVLTERVEQLSQDVSHNVSSIK
jgi:uncharacterized protein YceH (UPF0502 family)